MNRSTIFALVAGASLLASATAGAQCGGICLYENGSSDAGRAAAGAGARAQDASTAAWNPAAMTEIPGNDIVLGIAVSFGKLQPQLDAGTITPDPAPIGGGQASGFAPLFGGSMTAELPYGIHFGVTSSALYGGDIDYGANWTGRGYVIDASLLSFLIQPSLAYAVTDWLSLGAGPAILYTMYNMDLKVTALPGEPTVTIDKADDWSVGGVVSALVKPVDGTRIGIYYRTRIKADTQGKFEGPAGLNPVVDTNFTFPQGLNVSLFQQLNEEWALLGDVGWTDWSEFSNIPIQLGPVAGTQDRGWNDTWRIGVGGQYTPSEKLTLQSGFSYDSSPVKSSRLLPDIPTTDQYRFAAGLKLRPTEYLELSLSYQFLWFQGLEFDQVALPPAGAVVLNGEFDPSWAQFAGVTVRVSF